MRKMKIQKQNRKNIVNQSYADFETSNLIEGTQYTKYKNSKGGGGFAAEDANTLSDFLKGKKVETVGTNNAKNGADRFSNCEAIQTKYYSSGKNSVNAAFDKSTGMYKYKNQLLEVPKDQYEEALSQMKLKIKEGKVQGVSDPEQAKKILRQGSVTYKQARNIAKAGNIDSLWFDFKSQCVVTTKVIGISFLIQYANNKWNGMDNKTAIKISVIGAMRTGGITLLTGVIVRQFFRTGMGRSFNVFMTSTSKQIIHSLYKTDLGKKLIHKMASAILGKEVTGAAAKSVLTKSLRTNILTTAITTAVFSVPDLYRATISKRISWTQFSKNIMVNTAGAGAGMLGTYGGAVGGAQVGAAIGSIVPGAGTAAGAAIGAVLGGIAGALAVGSVGAQGTKMLLDKFAEDDAQKMLKLVQDTTTELAEDFLCTEMELEEIITNQIEGRITLRWLKDMYAAGSKTTESEVAQKLFAYEAFQPYFETAIQMRETIVLPSRRKINRVVRKMNATFFLQFMKIHILKIFGVKTDIKGFT